MPRRPIVIAYHLVWTAYGTWLPNDPRGSGSQSVESPALADLGELHYGRKRIQPSPAQVREFYRRAEPNLRFPIVRFDAAQIQTIACGFAAAIAEHHYTCYACAILADHVHLVIRKHKHRAEEMIENLQTASRSLILEAAASGIPSAHPIWIEGGWKRYLDSPDEIRTVIRYVERNLIRAKLPPQYWPFVTPYDGWPNCASR